MKRWPSPAGSTLLRFLLVGAFGEILYLGLYGLSWWLTARVPLAIAISGGICLVVNAVLHARVTFQVAFRRTLLARYLAIQLACLGLSLALGSVLEQAGVQAALVGLITLVVWSGCSFLLTRRAFVPAGRRGSARDRRAADRRRERSSRVPDRPGRMAGTP